MELSKATERTTLQHKGGSAARVQSRIVGETAVCDVQLQRLHHLGQSSASVEVIRRCWFAAGGPTLKPLFTADHTGEKARFLHVISTAGVGGAQFEDPAPRLGRLQVADTHIQMLFPQVGAQMTGFRQQRIADGDAGIGVAGSHQGKSGDFLQACSAEQSSQAPFRLLCRGQSPRRQGIRQMGPEAIKTDEACHFLDEVDLPGQIETPRRGSDDIPALITGLELTTEGRQALINHGIGKIGTARIALQGAEQLMQGIPAQQHRSGVARGLTTHPETLRFTGEQLLQQVLRAD